ncbi:glycosyltransferase [Fibrobacterota bacterium]
MPNHQRKKLAEIKNIGFVSTRLAGTDGVSLETEKWSEVLVTMGYKCFYFAGEIDRPEPKSYLCPLAHFSHPDIEKINAYVYNNTSRAERITDAIEDLKRELKFEIKKFLQQFHIDLLIVENAFAIPINIPLALALTEYIVENNMPAIAHNHDFSWERKRFAVNCVSDYLNYAFPPRHPFIRQVVINKDARTQLALRRGAAAVVVPNIMNYAKPPSPPDEYTVDVRKSLGFQKGEFFILQPTRVVQRKGIEHAIELLRRLQKKKVKAKLVISHASGDEGGDYERRIREYSKLLRVNTLFVSDIIGDRRGKTKNGRKIYSLYDVYPHADFVTYPSSYEGFGNAFLEAVYFKKPLLINNYSIYANDIKPRGFQVVEIDDYITEQDVNEVHELLQNPEKVKKMTEHNYKLAKRFYSYATLRRKLSYMLKDFFGEE